MRKTLLFFIPVLCILLMPSANAAMSASAALDPPVEWSWLVKEIENGKTTITLPNSIAFEGDLGLSPAAPITIVGNHQTLTGVVVDGGMITFKDVVLEGVNGLDDEDGRAGLTLRGEGAIAILSGASRAVGGNSGPSGERGGDGILLESANQGVILRNQASVSGGIGSIYGGAGVRSISCGCSVLATDSAVLIGRPGIALGGAGIDMPSCAGVTLSEYASACGGASVTDGGAGLSSPLCEVCGGYGPIAIGGAAVLSGGVGKTGGAAVYAARAPRDENDMTPDLTLSGDSLYFGAAGETAGPAIHARNCMLFFGGEPLFYGGAFFAEPSPVLALFDCVEEGDPEMIQKIDGTKVDQYPANDVSLIIHSALSVINDRYTPTATENGLNTRQLATKLNGLTVERGKVSQARVNGGGLKITLWNGTCEKRLEYQQRLMEDGDGGVRLVLIATTSQIWPTLDSTVAALRKLHSLGVTQLAYTNVDPVYNERIVSLAGVLDAVDAYAAPVDRVIFGTEDDCVIFVQEDGKTRAYQEELMREIRLALEEPEPQAET